MTMNRAENIDERVIEIVYKTIKEYQKMAPSNRLDHDDRWKDEIIARIQDYIVETFPKYKHADKIREMQKKIKCERAGGRSDDSK